MYRRNDLWHYIKVIWKSGGNEITSHTLITTITGKTSGSSTRFIFEGNLPNFRIKNYKTIGLRFDKLVNYWWLSNATPQLIDYIVYKVQGRTGEYQNEERVYYNHSSMNGGFILGRSYGDVIDVFYDSTELVGSTARLFGFN